MTIRQKKRAKLIGKSRTAEEELLAAGYAPSTARHQPPTVMKAKGWTDILELNLPDNKLIQVHQEGLEANKQLGVRTGKEATAESNDFIEVPDYLTRFKYLDEAYKLKGRLKDGLSVAGDITMNVVVIRHAND